VKEASKLQPERLPPEEVILALIRVVSGDTPLQAARVHLDSRVALHMDCATYRGSVVWLAWVRLIRDRGRIRRLRLVPCEIRPVPGEPELVDLWMRWSGFDRKRNVPALAADLLHVRFRVRHERIMEIWTHRINYAFMLGGWVCYPATYGLFKASAVLLCVSLGIWDILAHWLCAKNRKTTKQQDTPRTTP
jgi:hypothetical protein